MNRKIKIPLWVLLLIGASLILFLFWPIKNQEATAGWGDNGGGRESLTAKEINSGVLGLV